MPRSSPAILCAPSRSPLAEELTDIVMVLQRRFLAHLAKDLGRGNISFPQFVLLSHLAEEGPITMTRVAKKMEHSTAAATGLVDRLETLGYVSRQHSDRDRRKVLVQVTKQGQHVLANVRTEMVDNLQKILDRLEPAERSNWLTIYRKIHSLCQPCQPS